MRIIFTILLITVTSHLFAQNANEKDERQIYLWDVTLSMQGKAPGAPNIWEEVKAAIIKDIRSINNDRTEIVVIPFQHKVLEEWREPATAFGKNRLIEKINSYKIPLFICKKPIFLDFFN